jgi:hypothetical protein
MASLVIFASQNATVNAQQLTQKEQAMVRALETLDYDIVKYFPRWKVCEPSLQIHIYEAFNSAGFDRSLLNRSNIEVLAAPGDFDPEYGNFQILLVSCGEASMSPYQLATFFTPRLRKELAGEYSFSGTGTGRTYCFKEIPPEVPVSTYQAEAIINYMQPNDVTHAVTLSLFEQHLKIGESGFWLRSAFGNDEAGYPFWSSGQAAVMLQRPLYINRDLGTNRAIPYLMNFYFGGGYRVTSGIEAGNSIFSWLPSRILNGSQSGDIILGMNFHLPVMPEVGVSMHTRLPVEAPKTAVIEPLKWGSIPIEQLVNDDSERDIYSEDGKTLTHIVPMMHSSGKISLFYNWWLNKRNPENYIRADIGLSYVEAREMAMYQEDWDVYVTKENIVGLKTYKPEGLDWLYFRLEYRNQATWPFGMSAQISNQTFLGNVWVPIFGNWLLLEMKYSTVLRDPRPYELKNFLMFSPVIRITI